MAAGIGSGDEAVKDSGKDGFFFSILVFSIMAVLHVARIMLDLFLMQRFMLTWRAWLTDRLTGDWLDGKAYYRARFIDDTIDNPDQRIQTDIDIFTAGVGPLPNTPNNTTAATLLFGAISSIASMISFTEDPVEPLGHADAFSVSAFPGRCSGSGLVTSWSRRSSRSGSAGRSSGSPSTTRSSTPRSATHWCDCATRRRRSPSIEGKSPSAPGCGDSSRPSSSNYKRYVNRMMRFYGWNLSISQIIVPLPYLLQFPRFYTGEIKLGAMSQSASAFGSIQDGLSFFRNAYDQFAGYRAAIIRLHGLVEANEAGRALPEVTTLPCVDGTVQLDDIEVRTPDGKQLIKPLDMRLEIGDTLVITGPSGSGKTTLLRSLAELWPFTSGTLTRPCGPNETMFLSQLPYVPLGDLRAVVTYPGKEGTIDDNTLKRTLLRVALPHLVDRLDEVLDWAKVLSPGEQQRIAFARILLTRPKVVFLDESTSALDEGLEFMLYQLVRTELPDTILVSVSHRSTVEQHHTHELELLGDGEWRLGRVEGDEPVPV